VVGVVIPVGKPSYGAFWQDGQMRNFADILTSGPIGRPMVISQLGVISGYVGQYERLFVAIPSAAP